ncbi:hypothetical protein PIB30_008775 [Stylosanthes scabra]|uniref:Reverse transcriptase zinc-binding domain-containing protein n=1 Tax=Stylosanthes scabra TaxID=79078 RepID=A0ABU6W318_9FABA|nr:hypothetical protein [Stylosanthes scabra]
MHEGLAVKGKLQIRMHTVNPMCVRCESATKITIHCLLHCHESKTAWTLADLPLMTHHLEPWRWWLWLLEQLNGVGNAKTQITLAAILTWQIWKMRNLKVFEGKALSPHEVVSISRSMATEFLSSSH